MQSIDRRPKGPVRIEREDGTEVGIFPDYNCAIMHWMSGERIVPISQEEFDREMAEWRELLAAKRTVR
jgi:hypothetical protein